VKKQILSENDEGDCKRSKECIWKMRTKTNEIFWLPELLEIKVQEKSYARTWSSLSNLPNIDFKNSLRIHLSTRSFTCLSSSIIAPSERRKYDHFPSFLSLINPAFLSTERW